MTKQAHIGRPAPDTWGSSWQSAHTNGQFWQSRQSCPTRPAYRSVWPACNANGWRLLCGALRVRTFITCITQMHNSANIGASRPRCLPKAKEACQLSSRIEPDYCIQWRSKTGLQILVCLLLRSEDIAEKLSLQRQQDRAKPHQAASEHQLNAADKPASTEQEDAESYTVQLNVLVKADTQASSAGCDTPHYWWVIRVKPL